MNSTENVPSSTKGLVDFYCSQKDTKSRAIVDRESRARNAVFRAQICTISDRTYRRRSCLAANEDLRKHREDVEASIGVEAVRGIETKKRRVSP